MVTVDGQSGHLHSPGFAFFLVSLCLFPAKALTYFLSSVDSPPVQREGSTGNTSTFAQFAG